MTNSVLTLNSGPCKLQAEIEEEIVQLREERPFVPEARARTAGLQAELKMLQAAAAGRPYRSWSWGHFLGRGASA